MRDVIEEPQNGGRGDQFLGLSPREHEVLAMVASGQTNAEVAKRLAITVHAVKFHLAAIYRKLSVANRTEAAVTFFRAQASAQTLQDAATSD